MYTHVSSHYIDTAQDKLQMKSNHNVDYLGAGLQWDYQQFNMYIYIYILSVSKD